MSKITCKDFMHFIDAYLDYELVPQERRRFDAHIAHCAKCRAHFEEHAWVQGAVRSALARPQSAPEGLEEEILAKLASQRPPRRVKRALLMAPLPVAAVACVLFFLSTTGFRPIALDTAVAHHAQTYPAEIATYQALEMDRWFSDKLPFYLESPRFPEAILLGGRLSQLATPTRGQQPAAYLIYGLRGSKLSVLAYEEKRPDWLSLPALSGYRDFPLRMIDTSGYRVVFFQRDHTTYVMTSDLSSAQLVEMAVRELKRGA